MKPAISLSLFLLAALPALPARAEVAVTVDAPALAAVETVVVLPLGCGDDDCRALEDRLTDLVEEHLGLDAVPREAVDRAVERMGLNNPQGHLAHLLAQEVGADAYLRIQGSDTPRGPGGPGGGPSAIPTISRSPGVAFRASLLTKVRAAGLEMRTADDTPVLEGRSRGRRSFADHVERILKEVGR